MSSVPFWLAVDAASTFAALELDTESIDALARRRLSRLLLHAVRHNAFYRSRLQDAGFDWGDPLLKRDPYRALASLPPVSKLELRQAGTMALADGRVHSSWLSSASSGSTGEPFKVYYEPRAWAALKYAVKLRARRACGVGPTDRVAILDALPPGTTPSRLEQATGSRRISVLQPAWATAEALLAFQPDVIYGLPSALHEVARALEAQGDRLDVTAVFTSGELLDGSARGRLAAGFKAPIYDKATYHDEPAQRGAQLAECGPADHVLAPARSRSR